MADEVQLQARRLMLSGQVQGVGYRPFVHGLATRLGLAGWVRNGSGEVEIHVQGRAVQLEGFAAALIEEAPSLARPKIVAQSAVAPERIDRFVILSSIEEQGGQVHLPVDRYACADCLSELDDPADRRFRHPFINCTQCGPRYTLVSRLPYDRANTAMAQFVMCPQCRLEYEDPQDRRFHAEPIACPSCGPRLTFFDGSVQHVEGALDRAVQALIEGEIVAVKGVGGYHLLCDATREDAVSRLRQRKSRPHKPLAVLVPWRGRDGLDAVRDIASAEEIEMQGLLDPARPIVLLRRRQGAVLAASIAPGLAEVGLMLPHSPLHHLLASSVGKPLVATSANVSGEPVLTQAEEVQRRLGQVTDLRLDHDREILRPADDSVVRMTGGRLRPIRLGRGMAPRELELAHPVPYPVMALGGHLKSAIALAWDRRVVMSPHIGDLDAPRSLALLEKMMLDLPELYGVVPCRLLHDGHPDYASTRLARRGKLLSTGLLHHRAHASALAGEYPEVERWLVFAWDGSGLGEDGSLSGSEVMLGRPGAWQRIAALRSFRLPGGERAGREPWRSALALCWEAGLEWNACPEDSTLLREIWERRINTPESSGAGRLFDAAAALCGVNLRSSFEGQAPMMLEAMAEMGMNALDLPVRVDDRGLERIDWAPLLPIMMDDSIASSRRAGLLHASLARAIVCLAERARRQHGEFTVGLTGGVFQNRLLAEGVMCGLEALGIEVRMPLAVPANDAGLCLGQVIEFCALEAARHE